MTGLSSLTIVTSLDDKDTQVLCWDTYLQYCSTNTPVGSFETDAFTRDGAIFNKGLAMEEARTHMPWEDWILFFDADILPPCGGSYSWPEAIPYYPDSLQMGYLYGAWRYNPDGSRVDDDRPGYGYFQLFHAKDPKVQHTPLLSTHYRHGGNYDSDFLLSFRGLTKTLDLHLVHIGPKGQWFGVGKEAEMAEMLRNRRGRGIQPSERLPEV